MPTAPLPPRLRLDAARLPPPDGSAGWSREVAAETAERGGHDTKQCVYHDCDEGVAPISRIDKLSPGHLRTWAFSCKLREGSKETK